MDINELKRAVVVIGYHIPHKRPKFIGTGFLVGNGDRALTCAHVVCENYGAKGEKPKSLPLTRIINGVEERLWCWSFWDKEDGQYIIPLPILEIATYSGSPHIETYYKGGSPDVAYLILDINHRINRLKTNEYVSLAVAKKVLREIGTGVAMIGYPSPNMLMTYDKEGTPRCMEPLVQYFHLSGVLPALKAHLPHYLAFDSVFAKGSSGSPIVDLSTGEVVAIGAQLHPFYMPTFLSEEEYILTVVPSSIGFGVPSCFFYELSVSKTGIGKFEWDNFV